MKKLLYYILKVLSHKVIRKYRPLTIAITGSFGKTSAKEAIGAVLKNQGRVKKSEGNYNNEIGVPLTILGEKTAGRSIFGWLNIFRRGLALLSRKDNDYPNILILEMGAEKPGDIRYLTKIAPLDIGVITGIGPVHLEFFGSLEKIIEEKISLVAHPSDDTKIPIINADDENLVRAKSRLKGRLFSYGFNEGADYQSGDFKITQKNGVWGTLFKLQTDGKTIPVFLPQSFGRQQVYAALAALTLAGAIYNNLLEAIGNLDDYRPPKGRTNLIAGIKNTLLIDDTYNASPPSTLAALDVLHEFPLAGEGRKIAVFGEMLELGSYTEEGHQQVGKRAAEINADMLVTVGEKTRDILRGAASAGLSEDKTFYFDNNHDAGIFVQNKLKEGDLVLIKGSQGARMEQIVKELMAEPLKASELLVRQSEEWLKKV